MIGTRPFRWCLLFAVSLLNLTPVKADQKSTAAHFQTVLQNLDIGGEQFSFFQTPQNAAELGAVLDKLLEAIPAEEKAKMPAGFSLSKIAEALGFYSVKAYGSSGVTEENAVHRRGFFYIPGPKLGLTGLMGDTAKPYIAASNPEKADLVVEFELDLRKAAADLLAMARKMMPEAEIKKMEEELAKPIPNTPLTLAQVLEHAALRLSLTAYVRPEDKIPVPETSIMAPGADLVLSVDGLGWLLIPLSETLLQSAAQPDGPTEVQQSGNMATVRFKQPVGPPPMDFQPTIEFNKETGRITVISRQALADAMKGGAPKLGDSAEFVAATNRLPKDGNVLLYASRRFSETIYQLVEASIKAQSSTDDVQGILTAQKMLFGQFLPPKPQAFVVSARPDGIFMGSNSAIPPSSPELSTISILAVMAGMALPAMNNVTYQARVTTQTNKARTVVLALKMFAADNNGTYPKTLKELLANNYLEHESDLNHEHPQSRIAEPWVYFSGFSDSDPGSEIILLSPSADHRGNRIAARNDGSVEQISEEDAQAALAKRNR
ncbi:MAG: hypothetical protein JNJ83_05960 [Verrucomicrobiaceae bacterium]|nr:hypothetical protein [Verrucomicrobiaceae bacterium]